MLTLTLFEQSAFTVEYAGKRIAIDVGALTSPASLTTIGQPEFAIVSHIHPDHFDQANLAALNCPIYTVEEVISAASTKEEYHLVKMGDSVTFPGTEISAYFGASDHGTKVGPVEQISFIIEAGETALAFTADMFNPTPLPALPYSTLLIPIGNNGYTFDAVAAANYIQSIGFTGTVIPVHFRHFESSAQMLETFIGQVGNQATVKVLEVGESVLLG